MCGEPGMIRGVGRLCSIPVNWNGCHAVIVKPAIVSESGNDCEQRTDKVRDRAVAMLIRNGVHLVACGGVKERRA